MSETQSAARGLATDSFARWINALRNNPPSEEALDRARDCALDALACAFAGYREPAVDAFEKAAKRFFKEGSSPIWMRGENLSAIGAAAVNATSISILDLDDGNRQAMGHPGAAVVPTAFAVGQEIGAEPRDILNAIVAGYEVAVRVGAAEKRPSYHSGNYTSFGSAAVAAYLYGCTEAQIAQSLAICAYHGPRVADLTNSQYMGSNVKESIPWSVVAGISSVELAMTGFNGPLDALDLAERFDPDKLVEGLGDDFAIERTYFKKYSCCRWMHSAIEAFLTILETHNLPLKQISSVEVETFAQAVALNNRSDPNTLESAQYSVPYSMALAATLGEQALMPVRKESLHNVAAAELASKIRVINSPEMSSQFPAKVPAKVRVWFGGNVVEYTVEFPWGEASKPPSFTEIKQKLMILGARDLASDKLRKLAETLTQLRSDPYFNFQSILRLIAKQGDL